VRRKKKRRGKEYGSRGDGLLNEKNLKVVLCKKRRQQGGMPKNMRPAPTQGGVKNYEGGKKLEMKPKRKITEGEKRRERSKRIVEQH